MKKFSLAAVLVVFGVLVNTSIAAAQSGTISGTVQTPDALPVPSATVRLQGTSLGTLTDARGHFRITHVPAGSYTLIAEQLGFVAAERSVVLSDSVVGLKLVLEESPLR